MTKLTILLFVIDAVIFAVSGSLVLTGMAVAVSAYIAIKFNGINLGVR